jgi:hypothetical protein
MCFNRFNSILNLIGSRVNDILSKSSKYWWFSNMKLNNSPKIDGVSKKSFSHFWKTFIQCNLCNPTPEFSDILWHPTNIYGLKVFLITKIKPEYSDILYNPTHFPGPLVCRIRQVPLYMFSWDCLQGENTYCQMMHL